jgi:hypothetical protein
MKSVLIDNLVRLDLRKSLIKILFGLCLVKERTMYQLSLVERGQYAFGLLQAANDCKALGYKGFTVIEFGVAGGNGLVALEKHASKVEKFTGIEIQILGLDAGNGMPAPRDFRDVPYLWSAGFYDMDIPLLLSKLGRSKLLLGPVNERISDLVEIISVDKPIAFIVFDLDYYSSTMEAFELLNSKKAIFVPRVWCYFDDLQNILPFAGEHLAIQDFNSKSEDRKLGKPGMLIHSIPFQPAWAEQMYQLHILNHQKYNVCINSGSQLPLDD